MTNQTDYDQLEGINWSRLKLARTSPLQYRNPPPRRDSTAMAKGRAVHTLLLEPEKWASQYAIWPKKRMGRDWKAFALFHESQCILTTPEHNLVMATVRAIQSNSEALALLQSGGTEKPIQWTDAVTKMKCKGRLDVASSRVIDLKTTSFIEPEKFGRQAAKLGYHGQLAYYHDGLRSYCEHVGTLDLPILVVVQTAAPHDVVIYDVPAEVMDAGRHLYRKLLARVQECEEAGEWPGVAGGQRLELMLPEWAYSYDTETLTIDGERADC